MFPASPEGEAHGRAVVVIDKDAGPRRAFVPARARSTSDLALLHREALRVPRPGLDSACLDAYTDGVWPREVRSP
ncbi:hypothetical protein [Actinacidiphila glaucinigra]|uniref:hypothetical protein n=1 Tax=Actinacidiphila glaucinigra TaxID=235986 RepID=UPI0036F0947A